MRMQAVFNETVVAESDDTVVVEGNHYFPAESRDGVPPAERHPFPVLLEGARLLLHRERRRGQQPRRRLALPPAVFLAAEGRNRVAFWRGVEVVAVPEGASR